VDSPSWIDSRADCLGRHILGGNPLVELEDADTTTVGFVYQPSFEGFQASSTGTTSKSMVRLPS
jgi:hypothetical protein